MIVREMMSKNVKCISPSATLQEAACEMRDRDIGPLPVCGENDRLVGMITDRDITVRAVAEGKDPKTLQVQEIYPSGIGVEQKPRLSISWHDGYFHAMEGIKDDTVGIHGRTD
jgi:CBS domain-containing protein